MLTLAPSCLVAVVIAVAVQGSEWLWRFQGRDLAMAFRASEDGFDALTFHEKVDLKVTPFQASITHHHAIRNPLSSMAQCPPAAQLLVILSCS